MNLLPDVGKTVPHASDPVLEGLETYFAAARKGAFFGFGVVAIDREVSEVDKSILNVHGFHAILLRAEASKALPVDKGLEGMKVGDQHVDPQVKLIAVDEHGVGNIFLHHYVVSVVEFGQVVDHLDAPSS